MPQIEPPDPKALPLLRVIVDAIKAGRFREGDPSTASAALAAEGAMAAMRESANAGDREPAARASR
jgi:hypothetical protein